uniref:Putative secreted metalloprotease n=1 Tax=Amblyomma tuberculatum TaxID=48802 RepID=A0A6M2E8T7_9ACAR
MAAWVLLPVFLLALWFRVTTETNVVYPTLLESRGINNEPLLRINESITLSLEKSSVFSDEFLFITRENDEPIHYYMRREDYEKNLYHDSMRMASIIFENTDGVRVEGIIGSSLRIRPLLGMQRSNEGHIPHELYEISDYHVEDHRDYLVPNIRNEMGNVADLFEERSTKTLYPEIHLVADSAYSRRFGFSKRSLTFYFAIFLNAVNLRYKSMLDPKVQLRIIGITMIRYAIDEPFLIRAGSDYNQILDEETITNLSAHYKHSIEYKRSDLLYLITGRDMAFWQNGKLETWVGGYGVIGGICRELKVAMSEDRPTSFYGVYTLAHEVAHTLGCNHDGYGPEKGVPHNLGSQNCRYEDGYLMSYLMKDYRRFQFSSCCQREVKNLLKYELWNCLKKRVYNKTIPKTSKLPGQASSLDNYCQRVYSHERPVYYLKSYGVQQCKIRCQGQSNYWTISTIDGTECGSKHNRTQYCVLGECKEYQK